jgi:type IV pilus assembly protein PilM
MRALGARPWAGIDVGSYSVKLVAALPNGSRAWIAERPLRHGGSPPDVPPPVDQVARAVSDCLADAGLTPRALRGVSVGIAGPDVIVKQITLPLLDHDELASALRFEARKHLPFDPEGMVVDWQVLPRAPGDKQMALLLAAVSQDHLERHLEPLQQAGIDANIVDAAPLALSNALAGIARTDHEPMVLLDIGHVTSHLTVHQADAPYFSRRIDYGGHHLTRAIAAAMQSPVEEAEEWKVAAGSDVPPFPVSWELPEMQAVRESLRTELLDELRRSFAFYRTLAPLPDPVVLWVSGATARLTGLDARLSELLATPVRTFDPLEALALERRLNPADRPAPQFALARGLAMRQA